MNNPTNLIENLRQLMADRPLELHEAKGIAERQALRLLALLDQAGPPVDLSLLAELPGVEIRVAPRLPVSGFSEWSRGRWLIGINRDDAPVRRRFTLAHELKHVIDHPFVDRVYADRKGRVPAELVEAICDHFAACLLMPRPWLKKAWVGGIQDQQALAVRFGVSEAAMAIRLRQLGLAENTRRRPDIGDWNPPIGGVGRYFRRASPVAVWAPDASLVGPLPVAAIAG